MKFSITPILFLAIAFICSCCTEEASMEEEKEAVHTPVKARRTVIAYITADNNISSALQDDVNEMVEGSKTLSEECNLIAFIDKEGRKPYLARIAGGRMETVREYSSDFHSVSPDSMLSVFTWITDHYPAEEYAAIIEGHGSGAVMSGDTLPSDLVRLQAYGYDHTGESGKIGDRKWMNATQLASVFSRLPRMAFIFFDCCCMQSVEVAYEMRHCTDYILSPVSETPAKGAPYTAIVPMLSLPKDDVCQVIAREYVSQTQFPDNVWGLCISVVKTSELESLLAATRKALFAIGSHTAEQFSTRQQLSTRNTIYYYRSDEETGGVPALHDMKAVMKHNLPDADFREWVPYLDRAVVAKCTPQPKDGGENIWLTGAPHINFEAFIDHFDEEHYGALSMIVPNPGYDNVGESRSLNALMFQLEWTRKVGWKELGW